jgi:hypothetical protein
VVKKLLQQQRDNPQTVKLVLPAERIAGLDNRELAAWMTVGRALLNIDEFITRE